MKVKVLHLIDSGGLYGAEVMLLDLVEQQLLSGMQPLILSVGTHQDDKKPIELAAEKRSLPVKTYRMKAGFNLVSGIGILKFARSHKFQVLHSHGYKFNILLGVIPRFMRKIPVITTVHGYVHAAFFSKMRLYQCLDRYSLKWLDFVIFVSAITERKVNVKLMCSAVINNGVNIDGCNENMNESNEDKRVSEALSKSSFTVGAFGRLTSEKGFDLLIHAFKKVTLIIPDSKLIIWGDGYLRRELEELIRKEGLSDSVLLPGYTEYVEYYLTRLGVMVISSHTEGLPMVLLEAMKYKVPVIATEVGAISEVLNYGDCGLLLPPNSIEKMAEKILFLYDHREDSDQMVGRAYDRLTSHYNSRLMAEGYSNIYSSVA